MKVYLIENKAGGCQRLGMGVGIAMKWKYKGASLW